MNEKTRLLIDQVLEENVPNPNARKVIWWVINGELNGFETTHLTNKYLSEKFGWTLEETDKIVAEAKASGFISTTKTTFELNRQRLRRYVRSVMSRTMTFEQVLAGDFEEITL